MKDRDVAMATPGWTLEYNEWVIYNLNHLNSLHQNLSDNSDYNSAGIAKFSKVKFIISEGFQIAILSTASKLTSYWKTDTRRPNMVSYDFILWRISRMKLKSISWETQLFWPRPWLEDTWWFEEVLRNIYASKDAGFLP